MYRFRGFLAARQRRATFATVGALVLVAMATPAFEAVPAQAGGLPWPSPLHLSQPPHPAPPGQQAPPRRQGSLTEFDVPGANMGYSTAQYTVCNSAFLGAIGCGTTALANNDLGDVVGTYTDDGIAQHGFLRYPNGSITSFDAPGAGSGPGQGTVAFAINNAGVVAGASQDANGVYHGFLRYPDGVFVTIDEPGAGTGAQQGTLAFDVNPSGTTAGTYVDSGDENHGFVRTAAGTFASFDPPGSVYTYPCEETCLSPDGSVTGFFADAKGTGHGFVRTRGGAITTIDGPNRVGHRRGKYQPGGRGRGVLRRPKLRGPRPGVVPGRFVGHLRGPGGEHDRPRGTRHGGVQYQRRRGHHRVLRGRGGHLARLRARRSRELCQLQCPGRGYRPIFVAAGHVLGHTPFYEQCLGAGDGLVHRRQRCVPRLRVAAMMRLVRWMSRHRVYAVIAISAVTMAGALDLMSLPALGQTAIVCRRRALHRHLSFSWPTMRAGTSVPTHCPTTATCVLRAPSPG